jgi:hypothetical protein
MPGRFDAAGLGASGRGCIPRSESGIASYNIESRLVEYRTVKSRPATRTTPLEPDIGLKNPLVALDL